MGSDESGWKEPHTGPALRALPVTLVSVTLPVTLVSMALDSYLIWQPVQAW